MTNIQLPPGLLDAHVELFTIDGQPMALHQGHVKSLFELPLDILRILRQDLEDNAAAMQALELAGFTETTTMLSQYVACRFGNFDHVPDVADGELAHSEYHECGYRGSCPMEGIVCASLKVNGRVLSPFETEMIKCLATEDTIPVAADKMKVSLTTFEERKKVLFEKLGVLTRAGMVDAAYRLQILMPVPCSIN